MTDEIVHTSQQASCSPIYIVHTLIPLRSVEVRSWIAAAFTYFITIALQLCFNDVPLSVRQHRKWNAASFCIPDKTDGNLPAGFH